MPHDKSTTVAPPGSRGHHATVVLAVTCALAPTAIVASTAAADDAAPVMRTVAGAGAGDRGPAGAASVVAPVRVAATPAGLLLVEHAAHRIRLVDGRGVIRAFAGVGAAGFAGDGGPADTAAFSGVLGMAAAPDGAVYVADSENDVVRRVALDGTVTTFAGTSPGGADQPAEDLGDGGPARDATLDEPTDVAVGPDGTVYIADSGNARVRRVDRRGIVTTVLVGASEEGGAVSPTTLALGPNGELYVADVDGNAVWRVDAKGSRIRVAGSGAEGYAGDGGPAETASLNAPGAIAVDASGALLIADTGNHRVRRVAGGVITTFAGPAATSCDDASACMPGYEGDGGPAIGARLSGPLGIAVDAAGNVYVADTGNDRVRRIGRDGTITTVAGNGTGTAGDGAVARRAALGTPAALAVDGSGTVYVADPAEHRVRAIRDQTIYTVAGTGAVTCTGTGADRRCVGSFSGDGGSATGATLNGPAGVAVSAAGVLFVADTMNHVVRRVTSDGTITTIAGNRANNPDGTCPDALAKELAAENGPATAACLSGPTGVAVDANGNLYVADTGNDRVVRVTAAGIVTTVAGGSTTSTVPAPGAPVAPARLASLVDPQGVAVASDGSLFVAESGGHRVVKVDVNGVVAPFAGTGLRGDTGDGGAATSALLSQPTALAFDSGTLYIADTGNNRVRRVAGDGTISTVAGGGTPAPTSFHGDGGSPTSAALAAPAGVAVKGDRTYVSDTGHRRVRAVMPPPAATSISVTPSVTTISAGERTTLTGAVVLAGGRGPVRGVEVGVVAHSPGTDVAETAVSTDSAGRFAVGVQPSRRTVYVAQVEETDEVGFSTASALVAVRSAVTVSSPAASRVTVRAGQTFAVKGRVTPATANARVELVRVVGRTRAVLAVSSTRAGGAFTVSFKPSRTTYLLRVRVAAAGLNEPGESRSITLTAT